jgi:purine-binding chemotaxis protein CheW
MNLRGEIIGVIDLRTKLGLPRGEMNKKVVVVLNDLDTPLAVVVDALTCVDFVDSKSIHPSHHQDNFLDKQYIKGIYRKNEEFISLIDLQGLLDDAEISKVS